MSIENVAVAVNVIQAVTNNTTNIVGYKETIHEPIISGAQGPQGIKGDVGNASLGTLSDVSISGLVDGGLLVYSSQAGLWEVTKTLEKQTLECGQY